MKVNENGIIREMTEEEIKAIQPSEKERKASKILELKQLLADSDYKAIKYAEGLISESDYSLIKAQRQAWRDEINELENDNEI